MAGIAAAAIGVGGSLLGSAFKFFSGQSQKRQAAAIARANPFVPEVMPAEVQLATKLAQENYTNGMPGMNTIKQQISQNAGNAGAVAAKGATTGGDLIDAANKIQLNADDATRDLALQATSYKSNALGGYEAALGNQAGWQDKLYINNQKDPYLRAANQSAALTGAGNINEYSAIDEATSSLTTGAQDVVNAKYKNKLAGMDTNSLLALSALLK